MPVVNPPSTSKMESSLFLPDSPISKAFKSVSGSAKKGGKNTNVPAKIKAVLADPAFAREVQIKATERVKDLEKALELKAEGNRLFKENKIYEARDVYTQSLQCCPFNEANPADNKEFAVILANRSACLDMAKFYGATVEDIDLAIEYGYPKNLKFKVLKRKGHSLLKQRQYIKSKEAYNECLNMIGKSDMNTKLRDEFRAKVRKHMNVFTVVKKLTNQPMDDRPTPVLASDDEGNPDIPYSSSKLTIKEGKLLVGEGKALAVEDVLLREPYYAAILGEGPQKGQICPETFAHMPGPQPCSLGSGETFATAEARACANETYQRWEWRIREAVSVTGLGLTPLARLALRMVTVMKPEDVTKEKMSETGSVFELYEDAKVNKEEEEKCVVFAAAVLMKLLDAAQFPANNKDALADAVFKALCIAKKHAVAIAVPKPIAPDNRAELLKMDTFPTGDLGLGIYPSYSRLAIASERRSGGHADAFTIQQGKYLVMQCARGREAGAKVCLVEPDPEVVLNEMVTFRCSKDGCEVGFPLKENTKEKVIKCPMEKCGRETNIWLKLKRFQELKQLHEQAREKFEKGEFKEAKKNFMYLISEWEKIIQRPYKEIDSLEKELKFAIRMEQVTKENDWLRTR